MRIIVATREHELWRPPEFMHNVINIKFYQISGTLDECKVKNIRYKFLREIIRGHSLINLFMGEWSNEFSNMFRAEALKVESMKGRTREMLFRKNFNKLLWCFVFDFFFRIINSPLPHSIYSMLFFHFLIEATIWNNLMFLSPSLSHLLLGSTNIFSFYPLP